MTRIDAGQFDRKMRAIGPAMRRSRRETCISMSRTGITYVVNNAPRDTNRYRAAWGGAANHAGIGPVPTPAIRPSERRSDLRARLVRQAERLRRTMISWYGSTEAPVKRRADKSWRKLKKAFDRAIVTLESYTDTSIVIGGRKNGKTPMSQLATVRNRIYGGTGRVIDDTAGGRTVVRLHNLEPHASIVEKRSKLLKQVFAGLRAFGIRKHGRKYTDEVARASGFARVA